MGQLRKRTTLPRILLVTCFLSTWIIFLSKHKHNHQLVELSSSQHHERQRRLDWSSNCPPNLLSTIPNPTLPAIPMLKRPSYLASFPGSGDKIFSKYLVEMISGLSVGEAAVSPSLYKMESGGSSSSFGGGQGEVFGVRTHFPHTSGKLASWDNEIPLAIVILRNPIHAIPSYFDEVYELRNHLPRGSSKDPQHQHDTHTLWLKWRDNQFPSQIMLYRRFVSFWMERHIEDDDHRIFFTYEDLVDYYKGPVDSKRLHHFIVRALKENIEEMVKSGEVRGVTVDEKDTIDALVEDATKNLVAEEVAPCVWKELVAPTSETQNRRLQSIDPPYSSVAGGDWNPAERPLSPENLAALSQMLLELMNRWSRHQRLLNILAEYHRDVNKLYLEVAGKRDDGQQQGFHRESGSNSNDTQQSFDNPKLSKNFHIIQVSPPRTSTTTSINWLMGLFASFSDYAYMTGSWPDNPIQQSGKDVSIEAHLVTMTHDLDILKMYKKMRPLFDEVFFILSFEGSDLGTTISEELCQYKNVLCVPNDEFVFSGQEGLRVMISKLTTKLKSRFAYFFGTEEWLTEQDEINCYQRLQDMVTAKLDMADQPAEKLDQKFGIRGGGKKRCPPSLVTC